MSERFISDGRLRLVRREACYWDRDFVAILATNMQLDFLKK